VLDTLKKFHAKATFFCVGENIIKHPEIFKRIASEGHSLGNHTHNHLNSWKCKPEVYLENIKKCDALIKSKLFRPPYGKITRKLLKNNYLKNNYKIIFWDILSYDFDKTISPEKCLKNVLKHYKPGSVVVFHDNIKAEKNLKYALPLVLEKLSLQGYRFEAIKI